MSWTGRLQEESLTEAAFTACMAEAMAERLGDAEAEIIRPLKIHVALSESHALACSLKGLWQETRRDPALRAERCEAYLRSVQETARRRGAQGTEAERSGGQPGCEAVLPTVQSEAFVQQANRQYEQAGTGDRLCARPLAGDLFVVYVLDAPASLTFMTERRREELGLGVEDIMQVALGNLPAALPRIDLRARIDERPNGPLVCEVDCGGTYETSLLLAPALCRKMVEHVPGHMVTGVPARGRFLFAGSEDARGLKRLAAETATLYRETGTPYRSAFSYLSETAGFPARPPPDDAAWDRLPVLHGPSMPPSPARHLRTPKAAEGPRSVPFFETLREEADPSESAVAIYLTDGYGTFPEEVPSQ